MTAATTSEAPRHERGHNDELRCSFCGKSQFDVRKLIAGPTIFICDECVALCVGICEGDDVSTEIGKPDLVPTETLLLILKSAASRDQQLRRSLQDMVDVLRGRGVSWGIIGEALGVSRQAAWDRFS